MASPPYLPYAAACTCGTHPGTSSAHHGEDCAYRHYVQGYFDSSCDFIGKHLRLDFLDGVCARCGRDESGTIPS